MAPFFSVILPVYNVYDLLERCVQSVLQQGFSDYEILLVDDGSTDGSGQLCDQLAAANPGIRVIHKENGGLASARNAGLSQAAGQYIWFVDSDDWIEPDSLQLLFDACREKPDMVKFSHYRVTQERVAVKSNAPEGLYRQEQLESLWDMAFYSTGKYVLSACTHIYNRQFLQENSLCFVSERQVGSEDYLFNLQAMAMCRCICVTGHTLYNYEQRMGSLTQRYKPQLPERYAQLYRLLQAYYEQKQLLSRYESRLSGLYLWHLLRGTCVPNAYYVADEHTLQQGRQEITRFLGSESCQTALRQVDKKRFSLKNRLLLRAMKMKLEPVFYWLYVIKPRLKKGKTHENKA